PLSCDRACCPQGLRSFPTRRSSDLLLGVERAQTGHRVAAGLLELEVRGHDLNDVRSLPNGLDVLRPDPSRHPVAPSRSAPAPAGDRKSTRLNSSHQIISYRVFYLKK